MYSLSVLLSNVPATMSNVDDWLGTIKAVKVLVNSVPEWLRSWVTWSRVIIGKEAVFPLLLKGLTSAK
jgi:hypothetical protein